MAQQDSMFGFGPGTLSYQSTEKGIDLDALAKEDVKKQRGEIPAATDAELLTEFDDILSGMNTYVKKVGNFYVTPDALASVKGTAKEAELFGTFKKERLVPSQDPNRVAVPFSGPDYKEIRLPRILNELPADEREIVERSVRNRQAIARMFSETESDLTLHGQRVILNAFKTGDLITETAKSFRNIPGDFARLPTFGAMLVNGTMALGAAAYRGDDSVDLTRMEAFGASFSRNMQGFTEFIQPYEDTLNRTTLLESANVQFNKWYKEQFISGYEDRETGEKAWRDAHQREQYRVVRPGDADFDEAINKGEEYVDYVYDQDGNVMYEDIPLDPQLVSDLVDTAYQELAPSEKAILFGITQAPFTIGLTAASLSKGVSYANRVKAYREANPGTYATKNDWEVWTDIKQKEMGLGERMIRRGLAVLTLGATAVTKGTLDRGQKLNRHVDTLLKYDGQIAEKKRIISDKAIPDQDPRKVEAREELEILETGLANYKRKAGGSKGKFKYFNNPYTRSLLADDAIIATAVGYTPEIMDWEKTRIGQEGAEIITMLTAPLIAPALFRGGSSLTAAALNKATAGAVEDVARTLEHATFIPFITPAMLVKGEEADIRAIFEREGLPFDKEQMQAFHTMSKIYRSLNPEYQLRVNESLKRYGETMDFFKDRMRRIKTQDGEAAFTEDEIKIHMSNLHLSLAHATGLAPLIAVQARAGGRLKAQDLTDAGTMDELIRSLAAEEQSYKAMDSMFQVLRASIIEKSGVDIDSNEPLQQMILELGQAAAKGQERLGLKKQELLRLVETFYGQLGEVDENTLTRIVNLKSILSAEEIRGPAEKVEMITNTATEILEEGRKQARALDQFGDQLDETEYLREANLIADRLFDISYGVRKATRDEAYNKPATYTRPGETDPITFDLAPLAERMMSMTTEYAGKPFSYMFRGGKQFFNTGPGRDAQAALESAARRGLQAQFGDDVGNLMESFGVSSHTELALALVDEAVGKIKSPQEKAARMKELELEYFKADFNETEAVYRAFRDAEANSRDISKAEIDGSFRDEVNKVYQTQGGDEFYDLVLEARETHEILLGQTMDRGRYAGDVDRGRERMDVKDQPRVEGRHYYRTQNSRPITPFRTIARLAEQVVTETDEVKRADLLEEIEEQKNRIMMWYGARKITDAEGNEGYGFDLTDRKQRVVADTVNSLLEATVSKRLTQRFKSDVQTITEVDTFLSGASPEEAQKRAVEGLASRADYDFGRAQRINDVESVLTVPVLNGDGTPGTRKLLLTKVKDFSVDIDTLFRTDAKTRKTYQDMREEINDNKSTLRIAAQQEVDREAQILKNLQKLDQLVEKPEAFFDAVFENATPQSIDDLVQLRLQQAKAEGLDMTEDDIRAGLKFMYIRGLTAKSGRKGAQLAGTGDVITVVQDASVLVNYAKTPRHKLVMQAVMGDEHQEEMEMIANWSSMAMGDGMGFMSDPELREMSVESIFSRVFNLARGMVSPIYVASEVSTRAMMRRNQSLIRLALSDRQAGGVIAKLLTSDKPLSRAEMNLLAVRLKNYIATDVIRTGSEMESLNALLGEEVTASQDVMVGRLAAEQEASFDEELRRVFDSQEKNQ